METNTDGKCDRNHPTARQCNKCAAYFDTATIHGAVHLASCKIYNGHTNYETWAVALWLDNEEGSQRHWRRMARACAASVAEGEGNEYVEDPIRRATLLLADTLKEELDGERVAMLERAEADASMWADLSSAALQEVDWEDVAEGFMEGVTVEDCTPAADEEDEEHAE